MTTLLIEWFDNLHPITQSIWVVCCVAAIAGVLWIWKKIKDNDDMGGGLT